VNVSRPTPERLCSVLLLLILGALRAACRPEGEPGYTEESTATGALFSVAANARMVSR
jgi:hypothetical protein